MHVDFVLAVGKSVWRTNCYQMDWMGWLLGGFERLAQSLDLYRYVKEQRDRNGESKCKTKTNDRQLRKSSLAHSFIQLSLRNVPYVRCSLCVFVSVCAKNKVYLVIQHAYGVSIAYVMVVRWFYWNNTRVLMTIAMECLFAPRELHTPAQMDARTHIQNICVCTL